MSVVFSAYAEMLVGKSYKTGVLSIETSRMSFSADDVSESKSYRSLCDVKTEIRTVKTGRLFRKTADQCLCVMLSDGTEYIFRIQSDKALNCAYSSIIKKQEYLQNHPQEEEEKPVVKIATMVEASPPTQKSEAHASTALVNKAGKLAEANEALATKPQELVIVRNAEKTPVMVEIKPEVVKPSATKNITAKQVSAEAKQLLERISEQKKTAQHLLEMLKNQSTQLWIQDDNTINQDDTSEGCRSIDVPNVPKTINVIGDHTEDSTDEGEISIPEPIDILPEMVLPYEAESSEAASAEEITVNDEEATSNSSIDVLPDVASDSTSDLAAVEAETKSENTVQNKETLDIINQNYKNRFVYQCRDFALACCDKIPEKPRIVFEANNGKYLLDIMNSRYTHMCETYESFAMPIYINKNTNTRLLECSDHGVYASDLISAYDVFLAQPNAKVPVLNQAIKDSIKGYAGNDQMDCVCLMPDVVDDFSHGFREQLEYGKRLFQIPRSIAMAYAVQPLDDPETRKAPNEFICLDYDGEELMAIKIRREMDANGEPIFVRMGRFVLEGEHPSYRKLASKYIAIYRKKYNNVPFTDKMVRDLIDTKLLQNLLLSSDNLPVILCDNDAITDKVIDVWRDDEIVHELHEIILEDAKKISAKYSIKSYAICSFGYSDIVKGLNRLDYGCLQIKKRAQANKPLWEEYLPDLTLAVHQNGAFADLKLISKKDQRQQVTTYLGKVVDIVVENGAIVLAAGKEHYDLPLDREVYGNMNREKLARFTPADGPLAEDTQVELHVYYSYGDVDSYKLKAICPDGTIIESKWCDTEILKNEPPVYRPDGLDTMDSDECDRVVNAFRLFAKRIQAPSAFQTDTLYRYKYDEKRAYSRYLSELNERGYPFRMIRRYFDRDNQTKRVRGQIKELLNEGVFNCVADVLSGELPVGHNLGKGTSHLIPERDQADVLRENLQSICVEFGYLYTENHPSVGKILQALKNKKSVQIWAPITAYITHDDDPYGVWDSFSKALRTMKPKGNDAIYDLRSISNVCFLTPEWIFEFFHSATGREDVEWIIQNINSVIDYEEWNKSSEYNARKIRDVLELLLCICILKKEDPSILDCNAPSTKLLVKKLKKLDKDIREKQKSGGLKKEFNSRIKGVDVPAEYAKVNKVVYCLVQTLTGGDSISLVGFSKDD